MVQNHCTWIWRNNYYRKCKSMTWLLHYITNKQNNRSKPIKQNNIKIMKNKGT